MKTSTGSSLSFPLPSRPFAPTRGRQAWAAEPGRRAGPAPPRPPVWGLRIHLVSWLQSIFLPVIGVLFTNLPALDAQTLLLTGRYLPYRVTEKA